MKIMDAARELFVAEGYDAVTLRKVADKIEYSTTAIYVHFKDKQALIREMVHEDFRRHAFKLVQASDVADPVERVQKAGWLYMEFAMEFPNHYRLMFMTPSPQVHERTSNPEDDSYAFLVSCVQACMDAGRIRPDVTDVQLVAQLLWAGVHGTVSLFIAKREHKKIDWRSVEDHLKLRFDVLTRGLFVPAK